MPRLTRKDFLGLSAASAAAALVGRPAAAQVRATPTVGPARRTLVRGADLLTMDRQLGEVTGADVLLDGGKIAAIGKGLSAADAEVIDARGMILMPGMIDGHRHVWEGIEAGRLVKTSKNYQLQVYQNWKMKAMVCFTPEDAYLSEYVGGLQTIDSGVTSLVDYAHIFHTPDLAEQAARGMKDSGAAGVFCYQVSHTPSYKAGDRVPVARANAERRAPPDELHWKNAALIRDRVFSDSSAPMQFGLATSNAMPVRPMTEVRDEFLRIRQMEPKLIVQHVHKPHPTPPDHIFREIGQLHSVGLLWGPTITSPTPTT